MARPLFLTKNKAALVHESTIHVLERTGIDLDHPEAEALLLKAGARKDDEGRILIPRAMVQEALIKAYRRFRIYDRQGREALTVQNGSNYFGPGSDAQYNVDRQNWRMRRSVLADVTQNVRIADALTAFDFVMSMALPEDVEPCRLYPVVFAEMLKNTTKPLVTTATNVEDIRNIHHIAVLVAGDEARLRQRPFFLAYLEPISPLRLSESIAGRLLYCAEHGIPILFAAGANCGGGAPITPEGGVVQGSAESLAGLALALLKNPEAKFVYGANTSVLDMGTTIVCYGAPEWFRTVAMYADMGKYYNLPSWGTAGCSDAFWIDAQSAMEAYEGILLAVQSGTTLAHDVGFLAHGSLYDARMLVLTDAMIKRAKYLLKPAELSEEAFAKDVIDEVARQHSLFLAHPSTHNIYRRALWLPPSYINRQHISQYEQRRSLGEMLIDDVQKILATHQPNPLDENVDAAINQYLDSLQETTTNA